MRDFSISMAIGMSISYMFQIPYMIMKYLIEGNINLTFVIYGVGIIIFAMIVSLYDYFNKKIIN